MTTSIIEAALKKSVFFNQLVSRVGSAEALAHLPAELRRLLSSELTTEARERRADIKVVESKVQSDIESLSYRMETITAGVESAQAGGAPNGVRVCRRDAGVVWGDYPSQCCTGCARGRMWRRQSK